MKRIFTKPTNTDFYNRYKPIIPYFIVTGILAQVISAGTESTSIYFGTQQQMDSIPYWLSIPISILAVGLGAPAIELVGRTGLQVCARTLFNWAFKTKWDIILFVLVFGVSGSLWFKSYELSTQGIGKTFTQSTDKTPTLNQKEYLAKHNQLVAQINDEFDKQIASKKDQHLTSYLSSEKEYEAKITAEHAQVLKFERKKKNKVAWAASHLDKHRLKKAAIELKKTAFLTTLANGQFLEVDRIESNRSGTLEQEKDRFKKEVSNAQAALDENHNAAKGNAAFWGGLFSNLVGLLIIISFCCIVTEELFNKGAGIEIQYIDEENSPTLPRLLWEGLSNSFYNIVIFIVSLFHSTKKILPIPDFGKIGIDRINENFKKEAAEWKVKYTALQKDFSSKFDAEKAKVKDNFQQVINNLELKVAESQTTIRNLNQQLTTKDAEYNQQLLQQLQQQQIKHKQQLLGYSNNNQQDVDNALFLQKQQHQQEINSKKQQLDSEKSNLAREFAVKSQNLEKEFNFKLAEQQSKSAEKQQELIAKLTEQEKDFTFKQQVLKAKLADIKRNQSAELAEALDQQKLKLTKKLAGKRFSKAQLADGTPTDNADMPMPSGDGKRKDAARNEQKMTDAFYQLYNANDYRITHARIATMTGLSESAVRKVVNALKEKHGLLKKKKPKIG